ncbi:MAG: hypothetical protein ABRQ25_15245 [Clostridiaceae bacterium]
MSKGLHKITVEGDSIEQAREKLNSQVTFGQVLISENVISPAKTYIIKMSGANEEVAFRRAEKEVPKDVIIIDRRVVTDTQKKFKHVEAFEQQEAKVKVQFYLTENEQIESVEVETAGKRGLLGIGKKPDIYLVTIGQKPAVEIEYRTKVKISGVTGSEIVKKVYLALKAWYLVNATYDGIGKSICDSCKRKLNTGSAVYYTESKYLLCQNCIENMLNNADWEKALKNLEGYFGLGLPKHILELTKEGLLENVF